jgi:hypothetical protein
VNKLRLNVDGIAVESFRTGEDTMAGAGTVRGHEATRPLCTIASLKTDLTCCPCTPEF